MRCSASLIAVWFVALLIASASAPAAPFKAPGCFKRDTLEASLKGERKIPYDSKAPRLNTCSVSQPLVNDELRREGKARVAIFVFDVTGSGRVVGLQLIGQSSSWSEVAEKEAAKWLFEPLVEDDIGITRVGVTAAFIVEFEGHGQSCGGVPQPVIAGIDKEIRSCTARY
jgi:hypothetical protein